MKFRYEAHDRLSNPKKGEIEAKDKEEAASLLRGKDLFVLHLEEVGPEPQKTVLDHDKLMNPQADLPPDIDDIEGDIEAMREEARVAEEEEFKSDVARAWETCKLVQSHLVEAGCPPAQAEDVGSSVLKELVAEMAIRKLHKEIES